MSDKSYFDEIFKSFVSESEKLEIIINPLSQKSDKLLINEIIPIYYQIMSVISLMQFLKQNISNGNPEPTILEKIKSTENLIRAFDTNLHPTILSDLADNIQEIMINLKSNDGPETKIESEAELYEKLRQTMSTKEFVEQYGKGLSHD